MKLDEERWILGGGLTSEWKAVSRLRTTQALAQLRAIEKAFLGGAPASLRRGSSKAGLRYFLRRADAARDRLVSHPCFDYWLHLWDRHFAAPASESDWRLQFGLFQGFALALALERRESLSVETVPDPNGRFYFYGTPLFLEFPAEAALKPLRLEVSGERLRLESPELGTQRFRRDRSGGLVAEGGDGRVVAGRLPEVTAGLFVDDRGWLIVHGVTMHGLTRLDAGASERFAGVIRTALAHMAQRDPGLHAEMLDMLRAVIPLQNPMSYGSVSSSYANLRGAICLSHSDDPLLQAETLIHEYCHQKMNQLLAVDSLLLPGQAGQVFYSPWRDDARRLRGLLLGAHAFLNVARYLARSLSRERYPEEQEIEVMVNVARRAGQVEIALRSLVMYATFTDFGSRFALGMWRELGRLQHAIQWFPTALLEEQKLACDEHRRKFALFGTGIHRDPGFVDQVRRAAFLTPKTADEVPAAAPAPGAVR